MIFARQNGFQRKNELNLAGPRRVSSVAWFLRSSDYSETELLEWYLSLAKAASLGDAVTLGCHVTQGFAVDARRGAGSSEFPCARARRTASSEA